MGMARGRATAKLRAPFTRVRLAVRGGEVDGRRVWHTTRVRWTPNDDDDDGSSRDGDVVFGAKAIPKVVNAIQCACIDVRTYRLARKWYNNDNNVARKAFTLSLLSHWHFYCGCRSFANRGDGRSRGRWCFGRAAISI